MKIKLKIFDREYVLCSLLESKYIKMMSEIYDFNNISEYERDTILFPNSWNENPNTELKIEILKEAIEKKINLKYTDKISEYIKR